MRTKERGNWRSIDGDKEKYAAYLCSREWNVLREAVRERCGGRCERCETLPMQACHHLTYERKYRESLSDLQAICNPCHNFTHGKSDIDPTDRDVWMWLIYSREAKPPVPFELARLGVDGNHNQLADSLRGTIKALREMAALRSLFFDSWRGGKKNEINFQAFLAVSSGMDALNERCECDISRWVIQDHGPISRELYDLSLSIKWPNDEF